jgi:mono/diheme cytochrome c family protein
MNKGRQQVRPHGKRRWRPERNIYASRISADRKRVRGCRRSLGIHIPSPIQTGRTTTFPLNACPRWDREQILVVRNTSPCRKSASTIGVIGQQDRVACFRKRGTIDGLAMLVVKMIWMLQKETHMLKTALPQNAAAYKYVVAAVALVVVGLSGSARAQVQVKRVEMSSEKAALLDGRQLYQAACSVCHGMDGKGNGPATGALKTPPADLTTLARENHGHFPEARVLVAIRGDELAPEGAHGIREMPVWGQILRTRSSGETPAYLRMANVLRYVESIQRK